MYTQPISSSYHRAPRTNARRMGRMETRGARNNERREIDAEIR